MITNARDHLYLVVNAGCADKDIAHLKQHLAAFQKKGGNASMEVISDKFSLVALQGTKQNNYTQKEKKKEKRRVLSSKLLAPSSLPTLPFSFGSLNLRLLLLLRCLARSFGCRNS